MSTTIELPGAFDSWFSGSSVAQGQVDGFANNGASDLYRSYRDARFVRRGKGYTVRLTLTSIDALDCLRDYAETLVAINLGGEPNHAELRAAREVVKRCEAALAALEETAIAADEPLLEAESSDSS